MSEQNLAEQVSALTERHGGMVPVAEYMRMSTDHQRYSIEFQCGAIRKYAVQHSMSVVRTYLDHGKSGLTLKGRLGLQSLLKDVITGNINYGAILVYDVSRWGRFQDTDEAAYYEFMCKQAGVKVIYCAELFDDTPMGGLFKNIKRVMAGEFSRSQSARVWGGQAQCVAAGYKPGGAAGYGFRRMLVSPEGRPKTVLENRQYKMLTADKVILIPGPVIERETVWWIYDSYVFDGKSAEKIAHELNGSLNSQRKWTRHRVHSVLFNRKYTGACLFNRLSRKLKTRTTKNPEGMWIRRDRAFVGLVSNEYFDLVDEIKKANKKKPRWDEAELRAQLKKLLKEEGHLSANLIDSVPGTASAQTFINYFGSMRAAFASVGYCSLTRRTVGLWNKQREEHERTVINELLALLMAASIKADWDSKEKILWVSTHKTIAVSVLIFRAYWYHERWVWHIEKMHKRDFDQCLAVRMDSRYKTVLDYHLFPHSSLWSIPKNTVVSDSKSIAPFKVAGLRVLVSKWKRKVPVTESDLALPA